jgi:hypothetical protein
MMLTGSLLQLVGASMAMRPSGEIWRLDAQLGTAMSWRVSEFGT